jgi:hypothetical protein
LDLGASDDAPAEFFDACDLLLPVGLIETVKVHARK